MKQILLTAIAVVALVAGTSAVYAASNQTAQTSVSGTVQSVFSLEFYTDENVLYTTSIPFSSVDPANQYNYADSRAQNDGKSDVGLLVKSNQGKAWYLKIGVAASSPLRDKLAYYLGQPTNRNWGTPADGSIGHGDWFTIPVSTSPDTMYTAGTADRLNTPFGTLATLSFKVDGSGLTPGSKSGTVTYTLTETP